MRTLLTIFVGLGFAAAASAADVPSSAVAAASPRTVVTVTDSAGHPMAGVEVTRFPAGDGTVTDAAGKAVMILSTMRDPWNQRRPGEPIFLLARASDRDLATVAEASEPGTPVEIKLGPAMTVFGKVVDSAGKPVGGVTVSLMIHAGNQISNFGEQGLTTDAQGRYEIKSLPSEQKYYVQVNGGQEAPGGGAINAALGGGAVYFDLAVSATASFELEQVVLGQTDCSISGSVVDSEGKPVVGVQLQVNGGMRLSPGVHTLQPSKMVTTDDQGRFKAEGLCPGRVEVYCWGNQGNGQASVELSEDNKEIKDVQIVIRSQGGNSPPTPVAQPSSRVGKPLPAVEALGLKPEALKDKVVLLCIWDYAQKPSRHAVEQLAARVADLDKQGVAVFLVLASGDDHAAAQAWLEKQKITIPAGERPKPVDAKSKADKGEGPHFPWGVRGMPWLILADKSGVVRAEGFSMTELDDRLKALAAP